MEKILSINTTAEIEKCFSLMKVLRPHLTSESFLTIYEESHRRDGYELVAAYHDNKLLGLMGYRILWDYVRGEHLYIDDLVTSEEARSQGLGAKLLSFAEGKAKELGISSLRLCTGIDNERGVKFYEKNGWVKRAFAYTKKVP